MQAVLLAMALATSLSAMAGPLALKDLEDAVEAQNPGLRAAKLDAAKMRAQARVEGAWAEPQISLEQMPQRRRYQLQQTLPLFGQAGLRGQAAEHDADRASAQALVEGARLVYEAKVAYWQAQEATHLVRAQERTQSAWAALRKVSAQRGRFGRLDRMGQLMDAMLERELAGDEAMGLHWQAAQREASFKLERLMGGDGTEGPLSLAPVDVNALAAATWNADELWEKAQRQSPEWKEAQHHLIHAKAAQRATRRGNYPELMLEAGLEQRSDMADEGSVKVGINLPWFGSGQRGRTQVAAADVQHSQAMAEETGQMLREDCRMLASDLYTAQAELKLSLERILPAAERAMAAAQSGYSSGDIAPREAMDAVMGYWKAEEDYAHRLWHVGTTLAAIDRLMAAPVMEMSHD